MHKTLPQSSSIEGISTPSRIPPKYASTLPQISIDGVFNVRGFGYHATAKPLSTTIPGVIYRSTHLEDITMNGVQQIHDLRIVKIFDLRGAGESKQYKSTKDLSRRHSTSQLLPQCYVLPFDCSDDGLSSRLDKYASGKEISPQSVAEHYMALATSPSGILAFQTILKHFLTTPQDGILIHCTLGKDRTGIVFALLLSLAGVSDDAIADDYAISQRGLEPARPKMMTVIQKLCPTLSTLTISQKVDGIINCNSQCMLVFLQLMKERYGGAAGYVKELCGLSEAEIASLASVLTVEP